MAVQLKCDRAKLTDVRDILLEGPTTVEAVADRLNTSKRAARRALQYLVHRGQAEYREGEYR